MEDQKTVGPPLPSRSSTEDSDDDSEDYKDYEQSSDSDRGLEEDQYPGE